jgi:hypothetical protein
MCGPAAAQVKALVLVAERRRVLSKQALQVLGEEKNNQPCWRAMLRTPEGDQTRITHAG